MNWIPDILFIFFILYFCKDKIEFWDDRKKLSLFKMLIRAKSIINLPIVEAIDFKKLDSIKNVLVDPDNGNIVAFLIKKRYFWEKQKIVTFNEVIELFTDTVLIKNRDAIVDYGDVVKAKEIIEKNIFLLNSIVVTSDGKRLGYLEDFIFDNNHATLTTLMIKKVFSNERRIVSAERIEKISRNKIIIRDAGVRIPEIKKGVITSPVLSN